jgi:hypothetical protein
MSELRKNVQPPPPQRLAAPGLPGTAGRAGAKRVRRLVWSILTWGFLAGVGPVLLLALVITLYGWVTGVGASGFPLRGNGPPTTPLSVRAAANALEHAGLYAFLLGPRIFAVGSIVGASLAVGRWGRRNQ